MNYGAAPSRWPRALVLAAVAVFSGLPAPAGAGAQEPADTFALERFIVTATRRPLPADAVPAAVTVLSGTTLRARGARLLVDALRMAPGTPAAQSGSYGGLTSLYMRGGESDYVRVLVDGVPVNQPGGAFDFAHLRTEDVERIEIVRGPVSVLYGSDAVTGVVHVITRRGSGAPTFTGSVTGGRAERVGAEADGSFGSLAFDAGVSGAAGGADYAASVAHFETPGAYAYNNDYANSTASAQLGWNGRRASLRATGRFLDNEHHYPTDGAGRLVDANAFASGRSLAFGASAAYVLAPRLRASVDVAVHDEQSDTEDTPDSDADTVGFYAFTSTSSTLRRSVDARVDYTAPGGVLFTLGSLFEGQDGDVASLGESDFGPFADTARYERASRAAYLQLMATPGAHATITGGARVDAGEYGTFVTWRTGASVRPGAWVVRAAAGTGFKEPTFYENYARGFVTGNPDLVPERSLSLELGVERALAQGRVRLGATTYTQRFDDLIQYTYAPTRPGESNYFNLGAARARGIEATAAWTVAPALHVELAYDWLDTEVIASGDAGDLTFVEGDRLLRRPEHRLTAAATWTRGAASAWLGVSRTGAREDIDFSDPGAPSGRRVVLPAHTLVNAALRFPVASSTRTAVHGIVRVENALDERYQEITGFPARARTLYAGAAVTIR